MARDPHLVTPTLIKYAKETGVPLVEPSSCMRKVHICLLAPKKEAAPQVPSPDKTASEAGRRDLPPRTHSLGRMEWNVKY